MFRKSIEKIRKKLIDYKNKIIYYYEEIFGPIPERENAFVRDQSKLLELARKYLATYERREAARIIKNKISIVFTNEIHRPFTRVYEHTPEVLKDLLIEVERKLNRPLDQIEKAFLEWEIYNESEERIINLVIKEIFQVKLKGIEKYFINKRLKRHFKKGEKIFVRDIEDILGKVKEKRKMFYKYVG